MSVTFDGDGGARIRYQLSNSVIPASPAIDAHIDLGRNPPREGMKASVDADAFPSMEIKETLPGEGLATLYTQRECSLRPIGLTPIGSRICGPPPIDMEPGPFGAQPGPVSAEV